MVHTSKIGKPDRPGFTLIELLIVVVLIGILATIGAAQFHEVRERSLRATLVADMQSLIKHQELHHIGHNTYGQLADIQQYIHSDGTNISINYAAIDGWSGTATHDGLDAYTCGFYVGAAPAAGGAPATMAERLECQ